MLVPKEAIDDIKMDSALSEKQKQQLVEVCREYDNVLTDVPGRTSIIEHCVVLKSETPIYKRPYIMPYAIRQKVEEDVKNMLHAGIIEKSKSAYGASIVVVKKKDDSIRLCVDYKGLNEITIFDPQPMAKLDEFSTNSEKQDSYQRLTVPKDSLYKGILANSVRTECQRKECICNTIWTLSVECNAIWYG